MNKDGIYSIANTYHKVNEDKILAVNASNIMDAAEKYKQNKEVKIFPFITNTLEIPHKKATGCGTSSIESERTHDKRQVKVKLAINIITTTYSPCCVLSGDLFRNCGQKTKFLGAILYLCYNSFIFRSRNNI